MCVFFNLWIDYKAKTILYYKLPKMLDTQMSHYLIKYVLISIHF